MKAMLSALFLTTVVAGGATFATLRAIVPLTEPDKVLEIAPTALTTFLPPTTMTSLQQVVRPGVGQRGTQIDGAVRAGNGHGLAIGANPFAHGSGTSVKQNGMRLDQGTYEIFDVDLRLPSTGIDWVVGRTYNARQCDASGNHLDSAGYQGNNWFQISNPEVLLYDADASAGTEQAADVLYMIYGADRFLEFKRIADSKTIFRGVNGAAGVVQHAKDATSEPGTYIYTDQVGNQTYFFDNDGNAGAAAGQLWKIVDPAGNVAFFGHATTASTAISTGYSSGKPLVAYDTSNRRYSYSYSSGLITQVVADILTSGTWSSSPLTATVGKVEYSYHDGLDSNGTAGDLKVVKITTPLTDSGIDLVQRKYYRYYTSTYSSPSNLGQAHLIKLIVGFEGCRTYDYAGDATFDEDFLAESTANLEPYAEAFFAYDGCQRIVSSYSHGGCGCGGGSGDGVFNYEYESNGSYSNDTSGYDEDEWLGRTIVKRPDNAYEVQYFDEVYQPLSHLVMDGDPDNTEPQPSLWATYVDRGSAGIVLEVSTPANVTAYTHSSASFTRSSSVGLVWTYSLVGSSHTTEGFITDRKFKEAGTSGTAYFDRTWTYSYATFEVQISEVDSQVVQPVILTEREYVTKISSGTSGSNTWTNSYTWHGTTGTSRIRQKVVDSVAPAVSTTHNGPGTGTLVAGTRYYTVDGALAFEKSTLGIITYHEYANGLPSKLIEDADTTKVASGEDFSGVSIPAGFSSDTGAIPLHRVSSITYDAQGRPDTIAANLTSPKCYYTRLNDHRAVTLIFPDSATGAYFGPVNYSIRNQNNQIGVAAIIGLPANSTSATLTDVVSEIDDDPITAIQVGSVMRMTTNHFDATGNRLNESRVYHTIPTTLPGSDATNYEPTRYSYDTMGRRTRIVSATATITYTQHDVRGLSVATWVGTNDNDAAFPGGCTSGTCDMVKTEAVEYDGGLDKGNGYVTALAEFVQDSSLGQRVTNCENDSRGNRILEIRPLAPHIVQKYDNMGRRTAIGLYSSAAGLSATSDPTSTSSSNRRALHEIQIDEAGRVWESVRYKIDQSNGQKLDTLVSSAWRDAAGRVVKIDGSDLAKFTYDRLGRKTHEFVLATDDDVQFSDADDVAGDIVLEERQLTYDAGDGSVVMHAIIKRRHDDVGSGATTGALDTNADGDVLKYTASDTIGQIQIAAAWSELGRVTDIVQYGSFGGATFDRDGLSVPSSSATAHRTTYSYEVDGALVEVLDPGGHSTKTERDAMGRVNRQVQNFDAGVNGGAPSGSDDNITTTWTWSRTPGVPGYVMTRTADLPSGQTDQVTTYSFGVSKGTGSNSRIGSGSLLRQVSYPDSINSNDVVMYAYNAQGEGVYVQTQSPTYGDGNVIETEYNENGLQTARNVTTLGNGVDGTVRRITTTYTELSRVHLVTQFDAVSGGNVVNEVRFGCDGWGNLESYEEDKDSVVTDSGSPNDYQVTYSYAKNTTGRNTLRRSGMSVKYGGGSTLATIKSLTYIYDASSSFDNDASRVTQVKGGSVVLASYEYLGDDVVVGDIRPVPEVYSRRHSLSTSGAYDGIDAFERCLHDVWMKELASDVAIFSVDYYWDELNNIVAADDNVQAGFDVSYSVDSANRVTAASEGALSYPSGVPTIGSVARSEQWTLSHAGTWAQAALDLDGNGVHTGVGEYDDTRTHNDANEVLTRDLDSTAGTTGNNVALAYDAVGNLMDDGKDYKFVYGPFNQLRFIKNQSGAVVAEYQYNGVGHRIGEHADSDNDGDVDASDCWYHTAYDERWRAIATYRSNVSAAEDDVAPKEVLVSHQAGADGYGYCSYVNGIICRYKDANNAWTAAADGTLEQLHHFLQNWRGDLVAIVGANGRMIEWIKYSEYGVPFGIPLCDSNSDGDCDGADYAAVSGWGGGYDVRVDPNLDGVIDTADASIATASARALGRGVLSYVGNRLGLASMSSGCIGSSLYHARNRSMHVQLGAWLSRDPLEYSAGMNVYEYSFSSPVVSSDPSGAAPGIPPDSPLLSSFPCPGNTDTVGAVHLKSVGLGYRSTHRHMDDAFDDYYDELAKMMEEDIYGDAASLIFGPLMDAVKLIKMSKGLKQVIEVGELAYENGKTVVDFIGDIATLQNSGEITVAYTAAAAAFAIAQSSTDAQAGLGGQIRRVGRDLENYISCDACSTAGAGAGKACSMLARVVIEPGRVHCSTRANVSKAGTDSRTICEVDVLVFAGVQCGCPGENSNGDVLRVFGSCVVGPGYGCVYWGPTHHRGGGE